MNVLVATAYVIFGSLLPLAVLGGIWTATVFILAGFTATFSSTQ